MKAMVRDCYGSPDVLELTDIDKPEPADDEVLLRVHGASVNPADWHILRGAPYIARMQFGPGKPKDRVLGCDVGGAHRLSATTSRYSSRFDEGAPGAHSCTDLAHLLSGYVSRRISWH